MSASLEHKNVRFLNFCNKLNFLRRISKAKIKKSHSYLFAAKYLYRIIILKYKKKWVLYEKYIFMADKKQTFLSFQLKK